MAEWQTRTVQVRVSERTWRFNSSLAHFTVSLIKADAFDRIEALHPSASKLRRTRLPEKGRSAVRWWLSGRAPLSLRPQVRQTRSDKGLCPACRCQHALKGGRLRPNRPRQGAQVAAPLGLSLSDPRCRPVACTTSATRCASAASPMRRAPADLAWSGVRLETILQPERSAEPARSADRGGVVTPASRTGGEAQGRNVGSTR